MHLRRAFLAATTVAAGIATMAPADAAIFPVCSARLVNVAAGTSTYCDTNALHDAVYGHRRVVVHVEAGVVDATLTCWYGWWGSTPYSTTRHVSGLQPVTFYLNDGGGTCRLTLVATENGTIATGVSTTTPRTVEP